MTTLGESPQTTGLRAAEQEHLAEEFGRRLTEANLLDAGSLDRAKRAAATTGERFDHVLAKLGLVPEADTEKLTEAPTVTVWEGRG